MQPRATKSLASLSRTEFSVAVAEGLALIAEHVLALSAGIEALTAANQPRAVAAVEALADEEAAKYLILVDAVRCPAKRQKWRARQLGRFGDHLAKGIYTHVAEFRPASWSELLGSIEPMRHDFYLDGPNDVDWIFRNEVFAGREERLYVDYVVAEGKGSWWTPRRFDGALYGLQSSVVRIATALEAAGASTPAGLDVIAKSWASLVLPETVETKDEDVEWSSEIRPRVIATLDAMPKVEQLTDAQAALLIEQWHYPLYSVPLDKIEVDVDALRERQAAWTPDQSGG